jgi:hypothetical protein
MAPNQSSTLGEALKETLFQHRILLVPLPEEPIGVGATWDADVSLPLNGTNSSCRVRYTLVEVMGNVFKIAGTLKHTLDPGRFPAFFPDAPKFQPTRACCRTLFVHAGAVGRTFIALSRQAPGPARG